MAGSRPEAAEGGYKLVEPQSQGSLRIGVERLAPRRCARNGQGRAGGSRGLKCAARRLPGVIVGRRALELLERCDHPVGVARNRLTTAPDGSWPSPR